MSELPLDARAILQHLNELGYRNISAEQLREFLKGMQPQSDKQSASKHATTTAATANTSNKQHSTASSSTRATAAAASAAQRPKVKVIKSKRPLCHFKFYLDICDHQLTKRIEAEIKALGGTLEFFLTESITHFITDKPVAAATATSNAANTQQQPTQCTSTSRPGTPLTPLTPSTPQTPTAAHDDAQRGYGGSGVTRKTRQTRADAILSRVRRQQSNCGQQQQPQPQRSEASSVVAVAAATPPPYIVWHTDYAQRFFKRIQTELRSYLGSDGKSNAGQTLTAKKSSNSNNAHHIHLKGNFIKVEAVKRNSRPYYHLFKKPEEWPKIDLSSEDGAFRLQAKSKEVTTAKAEQAQSMTRRSAGSRSSQRKQKPEFEKQADQTTQAKTLPTPPPLQHAAVQALKRNTNPASTPGSPQARAAAEVVTPTQSPSQPLCREVKESSDKQCGVCEICKIEYDTLTVHLKTKDHEYFAKNSENFLALDTLIQASADVNKFLAEQSTAANEDAQNDNALGNDMEVDELLCDSAITITTTTNITTILESLHHSGSGSDTPKGRPSPALREKSKRITKGKHSSEKFQATTPTAAATPTPSPKLQSPARSSNSGGWHKKTPCSMLELQRLEQVASTTAHAATTPINTASRRKTQNSTLSPPIRAMLPPSSLYKVVEATDICATPPRNRRGAAANGNTNVDSPSLIVKFQKVRQSELMRLNGEAENFMFPRTTRSSSELATDVDRQTTSERARHSISSASLDSTSETEHALPHHIAVVEEAATPAIIIRRRATAVGKRRKNAAAQAPLLQRQLSTGSTSSSSVGPQQRFPSAPIQPETQTLKQGQAIQAEPRSSVPIVVEATRKSSRTATAIVTAATASSQLLRAAVEAAKNRNRQHKARTTPGKTAARKRGTKLEDRMGEQTSKSKMVESAEQNDDTEENETVAAADEDEDDCVDDDEYEDDDEDDGSDEDYVASRKIKQRLPELSPVTPTRVNTREERAARRLSRLTINRSIGETEMLETKSPRRHVGRAKSQKCVTPKSKQPQQAPTPHTSPQCFDLTKSERLQKLRYAFEQLPTADLWHRVFQRQDLGEEHYYTYYGSTQYRKLPYELGPIPLERTLQGAAHNCVLCRKAPEEQPTSTKQLKQELPAVEAVTVSKPTTAAAAVYKHKKLHLLQRYQQEQEQQQIASTSTAAAVAASADTLSLNTAIPKCDSKASTPELLEREFVPLSERAHIMGRLRAASTHSSSSCSTTASGHKPLYRNKQLQRIAELPPRKSPREHASTLALVSCLIRQRQDSQSKTNSEADEPAGVCTQQEETQLQPPPPPEVADIKTVLAIKLKTPLKQEVPAATSSPRTTRSQAATPIEELRFATEISETVKRMRRGQNKYDHSPPVPAPRPAARSPRGRRPAAAAASSTAHSYSRRLQFVQRRELPASVVLGKRQRRKQPNARQHSTVAGPAACNGGYAPGVRKLGTKKGVLEFEMEASALKTLDVRLKQTNPLITAWQLDQYLELAGKEYDMDAQHFGLNEATTTTATTTCATRAASLQTPPPTDCFTSEFDLCDLLVASAGSYDDDEAATGCRRGSFSNLYSRAALQSYYRKRKSLKSNRTGWPKAQKRRSTAASGAKQLQSERINFQKIGINSVPTELTTPRLLRIKQEPIETTEEEQSTATTTADKTVGKAARDGGDDNEGGSSGGHGSAGNDKQEASEGGVMTPPATDVDEQDASGKANDATVNDTMHDDDDETMADSVADEEQAQDDEAEIEATDADVEENDNDDDDEDAYENAYDHQLQPSKQTNKQVIDSTLATTDEPPAKRARLQATHTAVSPDKKLLFTLQHANGLSLNSSTPNTQLSMRQQPLRRTPQLNGSLGSCISPSEKLGDNSDIFTVSSDGLETDLDMSNTQAGDEQHNNSRQHEPCPHQTPKRKFDISKYAPPNNGKGASSCAAEAATAAVKSLAISQFLKKEVRVNCRRLRAPFRRFRYRR